MKYSETKQWIATLESGDEVIVYYKGERIAGTVAEVKQYSIIISWWNGMRENTFSKTTGKMFSTVNSRTRIGPGLVQK